MHVDFEMCMSKLLVTDYFGHISQTFSRCCIFIEVSHDSTPGRKNSRVKEYYRGKETALWTQLIPKLNHRDINSSDAAHELDHSENMSTFDDPNRLISKFWTIFPTPPPPPYTPPYNPNQMDTSYVSHSSDLYENTTEEPSTYKPSNRHATAKPEPEQQVPVAEKSSESDSSVPLSVTVVIGCVFLFVNLLVFAGLYYFHRKKSMKYRQHPGNSTGAGDLHQLNDTRTNGDRNNARVSSPESVTLMHTKTEDTAPKKVASINHKPVSNTQYTFAPISKPVPPPQGPGGYNYSALPQKTASPMHTQNQIQTTSRNTPPPREAGATGDVAQAPKSCNPNQIRNPSGSDQTPKTDPKADPRTKHIVRGNHTVSSNNAITIV